MLFAYNLGLPELRKLLQSGQEQSGLTEYSQILEIIKQNLYGVAFLSLYKFENFGDVTTYMQKY